MNKEMNKKEIKFLLNDKTEWVNKKKVCGISEKNRLVIWVFEKYGKYLYSST